MRALVATGSRSLPAVRSAARRPTSIALWLPLTPLLILLAPLVLVLAPFMTLSPRGRTVRPLRLAWALGALLTSLSGTQIDVDAPGARVRLRIL
jgi:hypothetical protein